MKWLGPTLLASWLATAGAGATPTAPAAAPEHAEAAPVHFSARQFAAELLRQTNRVRHAHGRSALKGMEQLDAAADDQAWYMAVRMNVQHTSDISGEATPLDRIRQHKVEPGACAENAAAVPIEQDGRMLTGPEIVQALITAWMNSRGHRANLLSRDMTYFGGAVRLGHSPNGVWIAYGVQDFIRPPRMELQ